MKRRRLLLTGGTVALAGCTMVPRLRSEEEYDIGMSANAFLPDELTVTVGDTVIWENDGSRAHTVTAYEGGLPNDASFFASGGYDNEPEAREAWHQHEGGNIYPGERYEHTFDVPGRYPYFCIPHEPRGMLADLYVNEA